MKLIGIDTSSHLGSVSVFEDCKLLGECLLNLGPAHSENLVASADWLLNSLKIKRNELQGVAVSIGPGSFTSLRVGVTMAKSLAYTLKLKIIGVSSLEIIASNIAYTDKKICVLTDAKRKEVYSSIFEYKEGSIKQIRSEKIQTVAELCNDINDGTVFVGDAVSIYKNDLKSYLGSLAIIAGEPFNMSVSSRCALIGYNKIKDGLEDDPVTLTPNYLRKSEVKLKAKNNP